MELTLPKNSKGHTSDEDLVKRYLDCFVINNLHAIRANADSNAKPFDTVRGVFVEGNPLFEGSMIQAKTHIQISVLNPASSIIGYFKPARFNPNI